MLNRRDLLQKIGGAMAIGVIPPAVCATQTKAPPGKPHVIQGVTVIRYPVGETDYCGTMRDNQDIAKELAEAIGPGAVVLLPGTRDYTGKYEWDLRVEGGDASQVRLERSGDEHTIEDAIDMAGAFGRWDEGTIAALKSELTKMRAND